MERSRTGTVAGARTGRGRRIVVVLVAVVATAVGCSSGGDGGSATTAPGGLDISAISTRAEFVTGGDVLVAVSGVPGGTTPTVEVDGERRPDGLARSGGRWTGLVDHLPDGRSTIRVTAGGRSGELRVTNHPTAGPLFSGPHQTPYACTTEANGLGAPTDADCGAPTQIRWNYYDTAGRLRPLPDPAHVPADVATATVGDVSIPLVVRTEAGVINRGVFWISVLDPTPTDSEWSGTSAGWNGDLIYRFGGGCGTTYSQGDAGVTGDSGAAPTADRDLLTRGYAVATDTLNTFQVACNDVLSSETALMVKEHFAETYGAPTHTIGDGGSGGAIQQFLTAQNYPGILDAASISVPFPDAMSIAPGVTDCGLLEHYYDSPEGAPLTSAQRTAINGHATDATCGLWKASFLTTLDPTVGCELPPEQVYDPARNQSGARCTLQDSNVNMFGRDPATGFARRPLDNVGVQYGLQALQSGVITADDFLTLNERVGGYDIDGNFVAGREKADDADLRHLYSTGRITEGGGDLGRIPMIVVNVYSDPTGDIHDRWRAFSIRQRLAADDGTPDPALSIWTVPGGDLATSLAGGVVDVRNQVIDQLHAWLGALDDATGDGAEEPNDPDGWADLMARTRPTDAGDRCTLPDGTVLAGSDIYTDDGRCNSAYPLAGDPRRAAGEGLDALVGKCRLRAVDPETYGVDLSDEQIRRLRTIFPDGVCDWSRPGVGQVPVDGSWRTFG